MALLTIEAAAQWVSVTPRYVQRLIASGSLPSILLPGNVRKRRIRSEDLQAWSEGRATSETVTPDSGNGPDPSIVPRDSEDRKVAA